MLVLIYFITTFLFFQGLIRHFRPELERRMEEYNKPKAVQTN